MILETAVAAHAGDIVMFDVPPPYNGVRGIEAYRATWPPFFRFQLEGASFEIVSLDVPPARTWPLPMRYCAAGRLGSWPTSPRTACG